MLLSVFSAVGLDNVFCVLKNDIEKNGSPDRNYLPNMKQETLWLSSQRIECLQSERIFKRTTSYLCGILLLNLPAWHLKKPQVGNRHWNSVLCLHYGPLEGASYTVFTCCNPHLQKQVESQTLSSLK